MSDPVVDIEKLLQPLAGDQPGGVSCRYEPEFEAIEAEIAKLSAITPQAVDWERVVNLATEILSGKSKDMLVASYLGYGLFELHGCAGIAAAVALYNGLIAGFWDTMFPEKKRLRGRAAAATWLFERFDKSIPKCKPSEADEQALSAAVSGIDELSAALDEKLGDNAPRLAGLSRAVKGFLNEIDEGRRKQDAQAAQAAAAKAAPAELAIESDSDIPKGLRACQNILKKIVAFQRDKSPKDPSPYRLNRLATWVMVAAPPPHQDGVTQLNPISAERLKKYDDDLANGEYTTLITEVENTLAQSPFWLDGHRYVAAAMEALGEEYSPARKTVIDELAVFLRRFPDLPNLKYADGTAFASDAARLWIDHEVLPAADESQAAVDTGTGGFPLWDQVMKDAKLLATKGRFSEGLTLFQEGIKHCQSGRDDFYFRLGQARFCYECGHVDLALPLLEFLDQRATNELGLEDWEPALCIEVAQFLLLCYVKLLEKKQKPVAAVADKAEALYGRLCRLDLNTALQIGNKAWQKGATTPTMGTGNL